ncbi:site-specific integrase [Fimbriiglobus ruber]|uniref:site-specific integrase n=1 Tax=Fimbriiglobus ruber TaxID=1908690 RepID=UPI000B4ACD37|nr:site-specific integrase [Fimbriiglobus ruber]
MSIRPVRTLFGDTYAAEFGPRRLAAVRDQMIRNRWCRILINRRIDRVKRAFKWATAEELVPVSVYQALRTLGGLQVGRTSAPESAKIEPVPLDQYTATLPHLPRLVRAMAELQRWTGMRPGEVCRLTLSELDRSNPVWVYRPAHHKTAHRGKRRSVAIGPKGQAVLFAFLAGRMPAPEGIRPVDLADPADRAVAADRFGRAWRPVDEALLRDMTRPVVVIGGCVVDPEGYMFNPLRDREERFAEMRSKRKSKVTPCQISRRTKCPERLPAERYDPHSYATAVTRACRKAGNPSLEPVPIEEQSD